MAMNAPLVAGIGAFGFLAWRLMKMPVVDRSADRDLLPMQFLPQAHYREGYHPDQHVDEKVEIGPFGVPRVSATSNVGRRHEYYPLPLLGRPHQRTAMVSTRK